MSKEGAVEATGLIVFVRQLVLVGVPCTWATIFLRHSPAPAILIVLTLGLAIGANSATFSLIDRVALRPLAERFSLESDRSRSEAFLRKARPEPDFK